MGIRRVPRFFRTWSKGHEGLVALEGLLLIQEVGWIEGSRILELRGVSMHRTQERDHVGALQGGEICTQNLDRKSGSTALSVTVKAALQHGGGGLAPLGVGTL